MVTGILNPTDFRYERKFAISALSRFEVESMIKLHPAIFSEIYHPRFVNNIYFDTVNMSSYQDNLGGINERVKVRIRWYGELFGLIEEPVLEFKIKRGFLGSKIKFPLDSFYLDSNYSLGVQRDIFTKSDVPDILAECLKPLRFAVLNHYRRKYFESADHKFRITLDSDMEFFKIDPINNSFIEKNVDYKNTILELKYSEENDEEAQFITNHFPLRITKSSKYVTGIESLHSFTF